MGTPEELFETPAHTFVGYFIGSPGMNLLDATIDGNRATLGADAVPLGATYPVLQGRTQIGIRPEFVTLGAEGLPYAVQRIEDVGRHRIVRGSIAGKPVNAILDEGATIPAEPRALLQPDKINVYADDWRVAPNGGAV
jgi:glycerol transport system ATP-binding protein